jgi:hypothetical protein
MAPASTEELTRQAGFIFEGAVRRTGAVTSSSFEATPATAVVQVEKVLKGPEVLAPFAGREITVVLAEHERVTAGTRAVFFTQGLHYGEGLVVREVGRHEAAAAEVEGAVREAMEHAIDEEILDRMRRARLIVAGAVTHVAPSEHRARVGTEHDPDWWECTIEVESVLKGKLEAEKGKKGKEHVKAFFAHSQDVMWYRSPKFEVGDAGVFFLHEADFRGRPTPGPATINPLDFQPLSALEHIRALLRRLE